MAAYAVAVANVVALTLTLTLGFAFAYAVAGAGALAGGGALAVAVISDLSVKAGRQGVFLSLFLLAAVALSAAGVCFLAPLRGWPISGARLLFLVVLTLVNAPFDWFAVGLIRALLRRGLAPGGRGPFFYAALDAILAPPVIALLAFVTVLAVQTFDDIAVLRAGPDARILPLGPLFEGLETRPGDPEFWSLWLMLFSTLVPSALNLCVAAASAIRGLPFVNDWIVKRLPASGALGADDRRCLAGLLAGQIAGGFLLATLGLYAIGLWFLPFWLPILGGAIRDFSEALAAFDAPARVMTWFAGVP